MGNSSTPLFDTLPGLLLCPSFSDMLFNLFVSLEDYLKLCLGHLVLPNLRREAVGYRSYREEAFSKSAKTRRSSYSGLHTLESFQVPILNLPDRHSPST